MTEKELTIERLKAAVSALEQEVETQRKDMAGLQETVERYRLLGELKGCGFAIVQGDGLRVVYANRALEDMLGVASGDLLRISPEAVLEWVVPEQRSGFLEGYSRLVENQTAEPRHCSVRVTPPDGVTRSLDISAGPVLYRGKPGVEALIVDRTGRWRAETDLMESRETFRAMLEAFDGLIYVCSQDFRVEFMNAKLIERTGYDGTGGLCYEVLHERKDVCPWCVNDRVFQGETVRWEIMSPKDNRWYYIVNTPLYHRDGTLSKQAMILDITERKRMEEALKRTSENTKRFAYSVSHDLKNPATAIHGLTRRLCERHAQVLSGKGKETCRHILKAAEHIVDMVEMINLYIRNKEMPLLLEKVRLKDVLSLIRTEFAARLDARAIRWSEPAVDVQIPADRLALLRVLRNLVDNALKYGGEGLSEIAVDYETFQEGHLICVRDNGVGLGEGETDRAFRMFERMDSSKGTPGTGLGLAITKEIIEKHGGRVWHGHSRGDYTAFFIFLPAHEDL